MDAPTLVYLLAVVAYSIYNWWKKSNKDSKKPQNSAPKTEKAEVPEWMKEIFGDVLGEEDKPKPAPAPAPAPKPVVSAEKESPLTTREPLSKTLEVKPTPKPVRTQAAKPAAKPTAVDVRSLESLESLEDVYATKSTIGEKREQLAAAQALAPAQADDLIPEGAEAWRRAIILQTVLERHEAVR
jgi:hypothetical protein